MPKFATKIVLYLYFWNGIWKHYCHIWDQLLRICLMNVSRDSCVIYFYETETRPVREKQIGRRDKTTENDVWQRYNKIATKLLQNLDEKFNIELRNTKNDWHKNKP